MLRFKFTHGSEDIYLRGGDPIFLISLFRSVILEKKKEFLYMSIPLIFSALLKVFKSLWPLWILLLTAVSIRLFFDWLDLEIDNWRTHQRFRQGEKWRSDREILHWLRSMTPARFEDYIADLFNRLGYKAEATGGSHDRGVDVIAEKDGIKHYIQCKKFITSKVNVGDLRDFYGAIADHLSDGEAYFITTNIFTVEAKLFAEDKPIELIDGDRLIDYIRLTEKKNNVAPEFVNKGVINVLNKCPHCGGDLIHREGKFGKFLGCSKYPKCKYTIKA